jgi:hypothetical protein
MNSDLIIDRYLPRLFQGEELLLAARLWTAGELSLSRKTIGLMIVGFDFYAPTTNVVSHRYGPRDHNVFFENQADAGKTSTLDRVYYLLGQQSELPSNRHEIEHLGMGKQRSLAEYLDFAGLDFQKQVQVSRCESRYDQELKEWIRINPD